MTPEGRTFAIKRMDDAPDLDALRYLWVWCFTDYTRRDEAVKRHKDKRKLELGG